MLHKDLQRAYRKLPVARAVTNFSTEEFLKSLEYFVLQSNVSVRTNDLLIIDKLCKKIEVPKRLVIEYSSDLSTTLNTTAVTVEYAVFITLLLSVLAQKYNDFKFYNTALKLCDGCLLDPHLTVPVEMQKTIIAMSTQILSILE
ncbi:hypothetical protein MNBD_GAMMA12-1271 [hydrothermal vent metagenome]|uniref:Uncharacterized protein n=1 Tax=hydrothermal vent metagenome TaxID=652676 RepID=A0A3B0XS92_9ZZZZ